MVFKSEFINFDVSKEKDKDNYMNISGYPKYIFWSYKDNCDLDEETIINNVCLYGDIKNILKAYNEISKDKFAEVINKLQLTNRFKKRINFIKKIIMEQTD